MTFKILTIFPEMVEAVLSTSILGRARRSGAISAEAVDIRAFSASKHKNTDDTPYGGGAGMVMLAQPVLDAMKYAGGAGFTGRRIYLSPKGAPFTQKTAERLAREKDVILLCGHYEGIDQRIIDSCIDEEISVGDYVLTGGELGALIIVDAVARLIKGVLGTFESGVDESFSSGLLEYPQYTHPREINGRAVPQVLLDGNQALIDRWRRDEALRTTLARRPEMLESALLDKRDRAFLRGLRAQEEKVFIDILAPEYMYLAARLNEETQGRTDIRAGSENVICAPGSIPDGARRVFVPEYVGARMREAYARKGIDVFGFSPLAFDALIGRLCGDEGIRTAVFTNLTQQEFACAAARILKVQRMKGAKCAYWGKGRRALLVSEKDAEKRCRIEWENGDEAEFGLYPASNAFVRALGAFFIAGTCPVDADMLAGAELICPEEML